MSATEVGRAIVQRELAWQAMRQLGARYVLQHGRYFSAIPRPKGIRRRAAKQCYRNAAYFVLDHEKDYDYCEGWAVSEKHCVPHAWVSSVVGGGAIEMTWPMPGQAYFGIRLSVPELAQVMNRVMVNGPFAEVLARGTVALGREGVCVAATQD